MGPVLDKIAQFSIPYSSYLKPDGELAQPLPNWAKVPTSLIALYRMLCLTRYFDQKAIALQRTGKLGTYPSVLGQEAIGVGIGAAMLAEDVLCPYYRELGAQLWRGVTMQDILHYWGGDERGSDFQHAKQDFPICVPIGSQTLHAVGVATAFKIRQQPRVAVAVIGDGGTSRGDFYEAMNVAGIWELPVVFVINNNQWAISVPRTAQSKTQTLAQKGIAAGIESIQIDGNDVIGVQESVSQALTRARIEQRPTVIEALSYRLGDHTTADDANRYRDRAELIENQAKDPLLRLKNYLVRHHGWDTQQEQALTTELQAEIQQAVAVYLNAAVRPPESMFDYLYQQLPSAYAPQRQEVKDAGQA